MASPAHRIIAVRAGSAELDREGVAGLSPTGTSVMGEIEAAAASVYEDEQEGGDLPPTGSLGQRVWASCGRKLRRWGAWEYMTFGTSDLQWDHWAVGLVQLCARLPVVRRQSLLLVGLTEPRHIQSSVQIQQVCSLVTGHAMS